MGIQADKLNSLIQAANVPEVEPIWSQLFAKALEGKDVKDLLMNVGSGGGGAAAAPAAGGAGAGGAAAEEAPKEEEKEEGEFCFPYCCYVKGRMWVDVCVCCCREGRVGRGYGFRSVRLKGMICRSSYTGRIAEQQHGWSDARGGAQGLVCCCYSTTTMLALYLHPALFPFRDLALRSQKSHPLQLSPRVPLGRQSYTSLQSCNARFRLGIVSQQSPCL